MVTTMQHLLDDRTELVDITLTRWEPCVDFAAEQGGAAVCAACGWLREEHPAAEHTAPSDEVERPGRAMRRSS
jgi:hypothetical protein